MWGFIIGVVGVFLYIGFKVDLKIEVDILDNGNDLFVDLKFVVKFVVGSDVKVLVDDVEIFFKFLFDIICFFLLVVLLLYFFIIFIVILFCFVCMSFNFCLVFMIFFWSLWIIMLYFFWSLVKYLFSLVLVIWFIFDIKEIFKLYKFLFDFWEVGIFVVIMFIFE